MDDQAQRGTVHCDTIGALKHFLSKDIPMNPYIEDCLSSIGNSSQPTDIPRQDWIILMDFEVGVCQEVLSELERDEPLTHAWSVAYQQHLYMMMVQLADLVRQRHAVMQESQSIAHAKAMSPECWQPHALPSTVLLDHAMNLRRRLQQLAVEEQVGQSPMGYTRRYAMEIRIMSCMAKLELRIRFGLFIEGYHVYWYLAGARTDSVLLVRLA